MGAPSSLGFNMDQTFFGFSAKDRTILHERLFELLWVGEGRWNFDDIYNLPLNIRKLWITKFKKIHETKEEKLKEQYDNRKSATSKPKRIHKK